MAPPSLVKTSVEDLIRALRGDRFRNGTGGLSEARLICDFSCTLLGSPKVSALLKRVNEECTRFQISIQVSVQEFDEIAAAVWSSKEFGRAHRFT